MKIFYILFTLAIVFSCLGEDPIAPEKETLTLHEYSSTVTYTNGGSMSLIGKFYLGIDATNFEMTNWNGPRWRINTPVFSNGQYVIHRYYSPDYGIWADDPTSYNYVFDGYILIDFAFTNRSYCSSNIFYIFNLN